MPVQQPGDDKLVVVFRNHPIQNDLETAQQGRPIFRDMEVCEIRSAGSRNTHPIQPALFFSHWSEDPLTGGQIQVTYAERFSKQYQQFKAHQQQTMFGTPLAHAPFLTEARRAELRACSVFTVEQLAAIDGQELKNLGLEGRDQKNRAIEYLEEAKARAPNTQLVAKLEAAEAKIMQLQEDNEALKKQRASEEGEFADMTDEALREYIKSKSGFPPQGNLSRKMLVRMAIDQKNNNKAA